MTPADIDRVFGRGRLRMVTGEHVEVYREASLPGERRRYTKRFLDTAAGDFRHWTEREWRILARLVGHGIGPVPDVVQFDRGAADRPALVQTYDAGITVDHWATLLPVERDGAALRHVFEDCAHWWALAHHCLIALDAIHQLRLVHLDLKADNVCIPYGPVDFNPQAAGQLLSPRFEQIALIDFAFSLVSGESLTRALPIARQHDYDYQSPRLLQALEAGSRGELLPTRQLDWRCDVFSLAAMLRRYLPDPEGPLDGAWTRPRHAQARALVRRLLEAHDGERPAQLPHAELLALTAHALDDAELAAALARGWTLAIHSQGIGAGSPTPVTRIAMPVSLDLQADHSAIARLDHVRQGRVRARRVAAAVAAVSAAAIGAPLLYAAWWAPLEPVASEVRSAMPAPTTAATQAVLAHAATPPPAAAATRAREAVVAAVALPASAPQAAPVGALEPAAAAEPVPVTVPVPVSEPVAEPVPVPAPLPNPPAPESVPAPAPARPAAAVLAKAPARAAVPALRAPAAAGKVSPAAVVATATPARASARPPTRPAARPATSAALPQSGRERALAWLTQRGPAPRSAARSGLGAWPAVALAPAAVAGAASPVNATVPARVAVLAPARVAVPSPVVAPLPTPSPASAPVPAPVQALAPLPALRPVELPAPGPKDFAARASELMTTDLPRVAQRAERRVARVMNLASLAETAWQDDEIRRAANGLREGPDERLAAGELAAEDARLLHEAARVAFWRRGNAREAMGLQLKAFGANPLDGDVVSNLAFLSLKQGPPQSDTARQLALYALSLPDPRHPGGRIEDWTTLAIASSLSGRERDARNAWFVTLALAPQPERQCRAAINAYAMHGERLRAAVEALLYRAHSSGRAEGSALCEWPPYWMATGRGR